MILKLNNNRSAEYVQVLFKNTDGSGSVTQYTPVCFNVTGNSVDGFSGGNSSTTNFPGFGGIALSTVAINGFGLATAYGLVSSILLSNSGTSITITAGDPLTLVNGLVGMASVGAAGGPTTLTFKNMVRITAGSTTTVSAVGYANSCWVFGM